MNSPTPTQPSQATPAANNAVAHEGDNDDADRLSPRRSYVLLFGLSVAVWALFGLIAWLVLLRV